MSESNPPLKGPDNITPLDQWNAHTVHQKILEALEDYEYGRISEEELTEFLLELNKKDEDHFIDKIDSYNEELRERLKKIDIAKKALEASGIVAVATSQIDQIPELEKNKKLALNQSLNNTVTTIKDPSNPQQVQTGIEKAVIILESGQKQLGKDAANKFQNHINALKEITMGLKTDYLASTRLSIGTGTVLQGPLGELMGLGFTKLKVDANSDGTKYISGFITNARHELASAIKATADYAKNSPHPTPKD